MANYFEEFYPVLGANIESPLVRSYLSMFLEYLKNNKHSKRKLVFKFSDHSSSFVIKNSALDLLPVYICLDPEHKKK
ncbi:hypothetical protein ABG067_008474, partial [Albugo candida]